MVIWQESTQQLSGLNGETDTFIQCTDMKCDKTIVYTKKPAQENIKTCKNPKLFISYFVQNKIISTVGPCEKWKGFSFLNNLNARCDVPVLCSPPPPQQEYTPRLTRLESFGFIISAAHAGKPPKNQPTVEPLLLRPTKDSVGGNCKLWQPLYKHTHKKGSWKWISINFEVKRRFFFTPLANRSRERKVKIQFYVSTFVRLRITLIKNI